MQDLLMLLSPWPLAGTLVGLYYLFRFFRQETRWWLDHYDDASDLVVIGLLWLLFLLALVPAVGINALVIGFAFR